jgi:hypothetical protein
MLQMMKQEHLTREVTTLDKEPRSTGEVRSLRGQELDEVSGGMGNLAWGAVGGIVSGAQAGLSYAKTSRMNGNYSTATMVGVTAVGAASGFLTGSGLGLVARAVSGAAGGSVVGGVTAVGAGTVLQVGAGGGSE